MKKAFLKFVDERQTILDMKKTHNKRINMASFIMESVLIISFMFGLVLLLGYLAGLAKELNYTFYSVNIIVYFGYYFLRHLYELRYMNVNDLEYKSFYIIFDDIKDLVFIYSVVNAVFVLLYGHQFLSEFNIIFIYIFSIVVMITWLIYYLFSWRNTESYELSKGLVNIDFKSAKSLYYVTKKYVKSNFRGSLKSIIYFTLLYIIIFLNTTFISVSYQYLLVSYVVIVSYVLVELIKNTRIRWINGYLSNLTLVLLLGLFINAFMAYDLFDTTSIYQDEYYLSDAAYQLPKGRISGVLVTDDYVIVKYRDVENNRIEIYDLTFNLLKKHTVEGALTFYEEKGVVYLFRELVENSERVNTLYTLNSDLTFDNVMEFSGSYVRTVPVLIGGEYHFIREAYEEDPTNIEEMIWVKYFSKYHNGLIVDADFTEGIFYESEDTIYFGNEDFVYGVTSHASTQGKTFSNYMGSYFGEEDYQVFSSYSKGYFLSDYPRIFSVYTIDENTLEKKLVFDYEYDSEESYYLNHGTFFVNFEIIDNQLVSYQNNHLDYENQLHLVRIKYDMDTSEYSKLVMDKGLIVIGEDIFELTFDNELFLLESDHYVVKSNMPSKFQMTFSMLAIFALLFTPLKTRELVVKEGENNV